MEVRGAPLIGATAAYGLVLSIIEKNDQSFLKKSSEDLIQSRPTAINLKWAVDRMMKKLSGLNSNEILKLAINEAKAICEEDVSFCKNIGLNGLKIIEKIYKRKKRYSKYFNSIVMLDGLQQLIGVQLLLQFIMLIKKELKFMFGLMKLDQETKGPI